MNSSLSLEQYVDAAAALIELPIAPEYRPGVLENLERTQAIAELVLDFSLPDDVEPAPIFLP